MFKFASPILAALALITVLAGSGCTPASTQAKPNTTPTTTATTPTAKPSAPANDPDCGFEFHFYMKSKDVDGPCLKLDRRNYDLLETAISAAQSDEQVAQVYVADTAKKIFEREFTDRTCD